MSIFYGAWKKCCEFGGSGKRNLNCEPWQTVERFTKLTYENKDCSAEKVVCFTTSYSRTPIQIVVSPPVSPSTLSSGIIQIVNRGVRWQ